MTGYVVVVEATCQTGVPLEVCSVHGPYPEMADALGARVLLARQAELWAVGIRRRSVRGGTYEHALTRVTVHPVDEHGLGVTRMPASGWDADRPDPLPFAPHTRTAHKEEAQ